MGTRTLNHPSDALHYRGHIAGLDVLRGVAILAVLFEHAYGIDAGYFRWHGLAAFWIALTSMGTLGVHLFFVLSGFLITGILLDGRDKPRAARTFYLHRLRRILPAYLLLLVALRLTRLVDWHFILASLLFVVNMGRLVGARLAQYSYVWSLAVEEQFYLIWPLILWRCRKETVLRTTLLCLVLGPLLRLAASLTGQDSYFKTWVNVDYLMYGALVAQTLRSGALHRGNIRRMTRLLFTAGFAGIALSIAIWLAFGQTEWALVLFNAVGRTPEIAVFVALLLESLIRRQDAPRINQKATRSQAAVLNSLQPLREKRLQSFVPARDSVCRWAAQGLVFLGYISYGLYLVHMVIYRLYDRHMARTAWGGWDRDFGRLSLRALVCSVVSILIAWLSRSTFEAWFLKLGTGNPHTRRTSDRALVPRPGSSMRE